MECTIRRLYSSCKRALNVVLSLGEPRNILYDLIGQNIGKILECSSHRLLLMVTEVFADLGGSQGVLVLPNESRNGCSV